MLAFKLAFGFIAGLLPVLAMFTWVLADAAGWKWIALAALLNRLQVGSQGWPPGEGPGTERFEGDTGLEISLKSPSETGRLLAALGQLEGCGPHLARHCDLTYQVTASEGQELLAMANCALAAMHSWRKTQDESVKEALIEVCSALGMYLDRLARGRRVDI